MELLSHSSDSEDYLDPNPYASLREFKKRYMSNCSSLISFHDHKKYFNDVVWYSFLGKLYHFVLRGLIIDPEETEIGSYDEVEEVKKIEVVDLVSDSDETVMEDMEDMEDTEEVEYMEDTLELEESDESDCHFGYLNDSLYLYHDGDVFNDVMSDSANDADDELDDEI